MSFARNLKIAREAADLTQRQLAELCGWGVDSQGRVGNYEAGSREPTLADIKALAKHTGTDPAELAFGGSAYTDVERRLVAAWRIADPMAAEALTAIVDLILTRAKKPLAAVRARK